MSTGAALLILAIVYLQFMLATFVLVCMIKKYKPNAFKGFFIQSDESIKENGNICIGVAIAWPLIYICAIGYAIWILFNKIDKCIKDG